MSRHDTARIAIDRVLAFLDAFDTLDATRKDPGIPSRIAFIAAPHSGGAYGQELSTLDLRKLVELVRARCEHVFPHDGNEPGDCRYCGLTYQQYDAGMGERIAEALEGGGRDDV